MKSVIRLGLFFAFFIGLAGPYSSFAATAFVDEGGCRYKAGGSGFTMELEGLTATFPWTWEGEDDEIEVKSSDYDGNGKLEAAVLLCQGRGTGVYVADLHLVRAENGQLVEYTYTAEDYLNDINRAVVFKEVRGDKALNFTWTVKQNGSETSVDITKVLEENELDASEVCLESGHTVYFTLTDSGEIEAMAALGFSSDQNTTPIDVASAEAKVVFRNGKFVLEDIEISVIE